MYTILAKNADQSTIKAILRAEEHTEDEPVTVCTDGCTSYDFLVDGGYFVHKRFTHGEGEYVAEDGDVHVICESQGSLSYRSCRRGIRCPSIVSALYCRLFPSEGLRPRVY